MTDKSCSRFNHEGVLNYMNDELDLSSKGAEINSISEMCMSNEL